jgi:hypothetical protein
MDIQVIKEVVQLIDEELHSPEIGVSVLFLEVRRATIAELIIDYHGYVEKARELGENVKIIVGCARTTVKYYKRCVLRMGKSAIHFVLSLAGLACSRDVKICFAFSCLKPAMFYKLGIVEKFMR